MSKKMIMLCILFLVFTVGSFSTNSSTEIVDSENSSIFFSEERLDQKGAVNKSEMIVKGTLKPSKHKNVKTVESSDGLVIEVPYSIYTLQISEYFKGEEQKESKLIFVADKPVEIELDKEYIFFLESNILEKGSFSLISYAQAFLELDPQTNEFVSKTTELKFKEVELKEKIAEEYKATK